MDLEQIDDAHLVFLSEGASSEVSREGFALDPSGVAAWLGAKNILPWDAKLVRFCDLDTWHRSGAETFLCAFGVGYVLGGMTFDTRIVVKAIVSMGSARRLEDWKRRHDFLAANGIPVSHWYWSGEGVILEDYYPSDFMAAEDPQALLSIAKGLDHLGFRPTDYLRDIRCDDHGRPHYIDFGSDLGEATSLPSNTAQLQFLAAFPEKLDKL